MRPGLEFTDVDFDRVRARLFAAREDGKNSVVVLFPIQNVLYRQLRASQLAHAVSTAMWESRE